MSFKVETDSDRIVRIVDEEGFEHPLNDDLILKEVILHLLAPKKEDREKLPYRRASNTFEFEQLDGGMKYRVTCGYYDDGRLGEVFLNFHKQGTSLDGTARDAAIALSFALQHGADIEEIFHAMLKDASGNPSTQIGEAIGQIIARKYHHLIPKADRTNQADSGTSAPTDDARPDGNSPSEPAIEPGGAGEGD